MRKFSDRKKAELELIAQLTLDATLAAEEKISRLSDRVKTAHSSTRRKPIRKNS